MSEPLAGPDPGIRFEIHPGHVRAVVRGVFPPEDAPELRVVAEGVAAVFTRQIPAMWQEVTNDMWNLMMYGHTTLEWDGE